MSRTTDAPDELVPTRHSLLSRLKNWDDEEGWSEFFDTYSKLIYAVSKKAGLGDADAQEVVQETVVSVAKAIKNFKSGREHGSFKAWLLTIVRRRIADQFRKRTPDQLRAVHRPAEETDRTATIEGIPDPHGPQIEATWDEEWERHRIARALARMQNQVSVKQFQIFHMLVTREMSPAQVAKVLGVSTTLVYVTKHRLGKRFKRELARIDRAEST